MHKGALEAKEKQYQESMASERKLYQQQVIHLFPIDWLLFLVLIQDLMQLDMLHKLQQDSRDKELAMSEKEREFAEERRKVRSNLFFFFNWFDCDGSFSFITVPGCVIRDGNDIEGYEKGIRI